MDIDLLSKIVKELILDNDEVTLPGVGSFVAELVPSVFSDKGYTINPPYKRLSFRQKETDDGKLLISFYAKCNNLDMETASKIMHEFLKEMRHILEVKKTILFPGLGKLRATRENCFFFVADEDLDIYPEGFGLEPISLKTHEETPAEVSVTMAALRSILGDEDGEKAGKVNANGSDKKADSKTEESVDAEAGNGADNAATVERVAAEAAGISAEAGNADISAATEEKAEVETEPSTATGTANVSEITEKPEVHDQEEIPVDAGHTDSPETAAEKDLIEETLKESPAEQAGTTADVEQSETATEKTAGQATDGKTADVTEKAAEFANAEVNAAAAGNGTDDAATVERVAAEAAGISAEAGTESRNADISAKQEGAEVETEPEEKTQEDTAGKHMESLASHADEEEAKKQETYAAAEQATEKPEKTGWKIFKWTIITLLILAVTALAAFMILAHTAPDFIDSILYTPEELELLNM